MSKSTFVQRQSSQSEMMEAEFQLVIENYTTDIKNKCDVMVRSGEDGYLHSEVGIDRELERLLAENPGLFMEDQKQQPPPHQQQQPPQQPLHQPQLIPTIQESLTLHVSERYLNMSYSTSFGGGRLACLCTVCSANVHQLHEHY